MRNAIDVVAFLLRWKRDQQPDYTITVSDQGVGVLAPACACCSIAVAVDFPLDADSAATLEALLDREWRAAAANCICRANPYTIDVRGMGRDEPVWRHCILECYICDVRGPSDTFEARCQGWIRVDFVDADDRGGHEYDHLGYCPECAANLDAQDRDDLGIDAA